MEILMVVLTLAVLGGGNPEDVPGKTQQGPVRVAGCPARPNCVSSEVQDSGHAVAPLRLNGDPAAAWEGIRDRVCRLPRSEVVRATDTYLHVTLKSRWFGFVDDLELLWDSSTDRVAIRSASRTGYSDLGVNRRRVEHLRSQLKQAGFIQ